MNTQETIEIYDFTYENKTKIEQVVYDFQGNPVHILPGQTVKYKKARRKPGDIPAVVVIQNSKEEKEEKKDVSDTSDVKGESETKGRESKKDTAGRTGRHFDRQ